MVGAAGPAAPLLLVGGVLLLVSALAARSWAGLDTGGAGPWSGVGHAWSPIRSSIRGGARRGRGRRPPGRGVGAGAAPARRCAARLAGERMWMAGTLGPLRGSAAVRPRHPPRRWPVSTRSGRVAGPGAAPVPRPANGLRRLLMAGTGSFSRGATLAASRASSSATTGTRARSWPPPSSGAGLTHLLAVSGQNVAFLLAVLAPLLCRLRLWPRFAATLAALGFFALTTRFEPSVLRAVVMAGHRGAGATPGPSGLEPAGALPGGRRRCSPSTRSSCTRSASSCRCSPRSAS